MEFTAFGKTSFKVSCMGMGTYFDPFWILLATILRIRRHAQRSIHALKLGLDAGINLIDTAEIYQTEPLVAEAIASRKRDELFIASKVWSTHLHQDDVLRTCERSPNRLKTRYLDFYQIHWPNRRVPIRERMRALEKLGDDGKIRYIGVSNFSLHQTLEAEHALSRHELVSTQMNYSLAHRRVERDILPHCVAEKIALLAYFPLTHGRLAGAKMRASEAYRKISATHKGKTRDPNALNWLCTKSDWVFPIPRGSNPQHVKEHLEAVGWRLDESDMELLSNAFPV